MQRMRRTNLWLLIAVAALSARASADAPSPLRPAAAEFGQDPARPVEASKVSAAPEQVGLPPHARVFTADVGMIINYIKPEKTGDFEMLVGRLKDALARSDRPERKAQAAGWRVLKMVEPMADGSVVYVFLFDPVVKDTDYSPSRILAEAFPGEMTELFKTYSDCFVGGVSLANYQMLTTMR